MKRKGRRLLALALALVMVFALVSCGNSTSEETQEDEPVTEESAVQEEQETEGGEESETGIEEKAESEDTIEEEAEAEEEDEPVTEEPVVQEEQETEGGEESETGIEEKEESEEAIEEESEPEEEEDETIEIGLGDSIETDKFTMRFDSVEFYDDGTIWISEKESMTTTMSEGCKRIALKTHFESFASSSISSPSSTFKVSLLINGEYAYDTSSTGILAPGFSLDPLEENDIYIYADVPEKAIDILEKAEFTIAFNDDLSEVISTTDKGGARTFEADNFYTVVLNFD